MSKSVFAIEGLDRLGKSTLIDGIVNKLGYYEVIHFSKPKKLDAYQHTTWTDWKIVPGTATKIDKPDLFYYQHESFINSMLIAKSGARVIFDRWHLGEAVYSPLYRDYSGDYVFDIERNMQMDSRHDMRLILLTEDFQIARHFVDDGESLGSVEAREKEQEMFIAAFERSIIPDKRIICVTDQGLGGFKPKEWILQEALY